MEPQSKIGYKKAHSIILLIEIKELSYFFSLLRMEENKVKIRAKIINLFSLQKQKKTTENEI